jgi:hypothetical protein
MVQVVATILLLGLLTVPRSSGADPIQLADGTSLDLRVSVDSSIALVRGETGFVTAVIENTGTAPASFKPYDPANPIGGFGWDFNAPALAIGLGGRSCEPGISKLVIADGLVDPVTPRAFSCCFGSPDFSHLGGVTVNPGEALTFELFSMVALAGARPGLLTNMTTSIELAFAAPVFAGFASGLFTIGVTVAADAAHGPLQSLALTNFTFPPGPPPSTPVPTPTSLLLVIAAGVVFRFAPASEVVVQGHSPVRSGSRRKFDLGEPCTAGTPSGRTKGQAVPRKPQRP